MATSSNNTSVTVGPSGSFLLFLVFLVLKLTEVIDWSWWWVTAPLWIPAIIVIPIIIVVFLVAAGSSGRRR